MRDIYSTKISWEDGVGVDEGKRNVKKLISGIDNEIKVGKH